jgi:hypothetical protein
MLSSIKTDLQNSHSKARNRLLLGLTVSLRLLLTNFVTSGAIYAQKAKAAIKRAYLKSKNLQSTDPEFEDDQLIDQSPLSAFAEMDDAAYDQILLLFDLFEPLAQLGKASMVPETNQLTVLSVAAFDTALLLLTFIIKIVLTKVDQKAVEIESEQSSSVVQRLLAPPFVEALVSSLSNLLRDISIGYQNLRPLYAVCSEIITNLLNRDSPFEAPDAISSLYITLDLWIPIFIEDISFLPAGITLALTDSLEKILSDAAPIVSLVKENTAPRRRLLAASETLERLLLVLALQLGKCGPKKLAQVLSNNRGERIMELVKSAQSYTDSSYVVLESACLLQHLPGGHPASCLKKLIQAAPEIAGAFTSYHILSLLLSNESALDQPVASLILAPQSSERMWALTLLQRATEYWIDCYKRKKVLKVDRIDVLLRSLLTAIEKWDDQLVSRIPIAAMSSSLDIVLDTFKAIVSFHVSQLKAGRDAGNFIFQLEVDLFRSCSETRQALEHLFDLTFKCVPFQPPKRRNKRRDLNRLSCSFCRQLQNSEKGLSSVVSMLSKWIEMVRDQKKKRNAESQKIY